MNENNIKTFFTFLQSEQTAQQFLYKQYQNIEGMNADMMSYENCQSFIYYIKHGLHFYETGRRLSTILQPILFFYGMTHLIKAVLLTKRPHYPESTKLLAHGVSSRKRKKRNYIFMDDEVMIHNHGLFSYFSKHLYGIERLNKSKLKMGDLLELVPEMSSLFTLHGQEVLVQIGKFGSKKLKFPIHLLDHYHVTSKAFIRHLHALSPNILSTHISHHHIELELKTTIKSSSGPFFFNMLDHSLSFPINRDLFMPISEVMIHYLLLYNLSMLSRYETEWWGELIATKPNTDYPFIVHFLCNSSRKIPLLLGNEMHQDYLKH